MDRKSETVFNLTLTDRALGRLPALRLHFVSADSSPQTTGFGMTGGGGGVLSVEFLVLSCEGVFGFGRRSASFRRGLV